MADWKFAPPDYQWRREPNCTYWRLKSAQNDGWRFSKGRREAPEICPLQNQFSAKPWCCQLKNMRENLTWLSLYQLKWLCILQWVKSGRTWLPHIYWEKWEKQIIWRIYSIKFSQRTHNLQQRFQERERETQNLPGEYLWKMPNIPPHIWPKHFPEPDSLKPK